MSIEPLALAELLLWQQPSDASSVGRFGLDKWSEYSTDVDVRQIGVRSALMSATFSFPTHALFCCIISKIDRKFSDFVLMTVGSRCIYSCG
jgi:hypothetical protein